MSNFASTFIKTTLIYLYLIMCIIYKQFTVSGQSEKDNCVYSCTSDKEAI